MAYVFSPHRSLRVTTGNPYTADAAKLLLRVVLGVLMLLHGISKIKGGLGPIFGAVDKAGLPLR